jgi:hypothetical protein
MFSVRKKCHPFIIIKNFKLQKLFIIPRHDGSSAGSEIETGSSGPLSVFFMHCYTLKNNKDVKRNVLSISKQGRGG